MRREGRIGVASMAPVGYFRPHMFQERDLHSLHEGIEPTVEFYTECSNPFHSSLES